jgi:diguanylate cyclase
LHYSYGWVTVSITISMIAAYSAFSLADRMRLAVTKTTHRLWLLGGSVAMGTGIWSMHYLGMLAAQMPGNISYYLPTVALSFAMAIAASAVALEVVSAAEWGRWQWVFSGSLMGAGIGGMHYTGMAAMQGTTRYHYSLPVVLLSVLTAVTFSTLSLRLVFAVRDRLRYSEILRVGAGILMGLGIAATHYMAMAAIRYSSGDVHSAASAWSVQVTTLGEGAVALVTAIVLLGALLTAALDKSRYFAVETARQALLATQAEMLQSQRDLIEKKEQLAEANAMLSELSIRDGLTGLHNRRHFDHIFDMEWRRAYRTKKSLAVLMIDVDCFKALNDAVGHQRGDDCLREVARVLETQPRRGHDLTARYGGEEFAVILPDADFKFAMRIAEKTRQAVLDLGLEHPASGVSPFVTVSIGVCSRVPSSSEDAAVTLRDADRALYQAKRDGRNQVSGSLEVALPPGRRERPV